VLVELEGCDNTEHDTGLDGRRGRDDSRGDDHDCGVWRRGREDVVVG
jgi:hypothetical protein